MTPVQTVADKFRAIVVDQLGVLPEEVTSDATFDQDLNCDSLDHIEILMACEEEFEIEISDEDGERLKTVHDAVVYLEQRVSEPKTARAN